MCSERAVRAAVKGDARSGSRSPPVVHHANCLTKDLNEEPSLREPDPPAGAEPDRAQPDVSALQAVRISAGSESLLRTVMLVGRDLLGTSASTGATNELPRTASRGRSITATRANEPQSLLRPCRR